MENLEKNCCAKSVAISADERDFVKNQIEKMLEARAGFFAVLDKNVPKKGNSNVFDFEKCQDKSLKGLYGEFYAYDYAIRRLLPKIYEKFGVNFNV